MVNKVGGQTSRQRSLGVLLASLGMPGMIQPIRQNAFIGPPGLLTRLAVARFIFAEKVHESKDGASLMLKSSMRAVKHTCRLKHAHHRPATVGDDYSRGSFALSWLAEGAGTATTFQLTQANRQKSRSR
jgi:hypothetical protein